MEILQSLGLNHTILHHMAIFLVAYIFSYKFLFQPYLNRYEMRKEQTAGQESFAEDLDLKTQTLNQQHDELLKKLNNEVQQKYSDFKTAADRQAREIMDQARSESENFLAQANQKITKETELARQVFKQEVTGVSNEIVEKLVGRNI